MSVTFTPKSGSLGQIIHEEPDKAPRLEFFIEAAFAAIEVDGEEVSPLFRASGIVVPAKSWRDLSETSPTFPWAPKPGSIEAGVPLFGIHNPADVTKIDFGAIHDGRLPAVFSTEIDFEIEADRDDFGTVELDLDLALEVQPLKIATSIARRCHNEPEAIRNAIADLVDLTAYNSIEKVPGGFMMAVAHN